MTGHHFTSRGLCHQARWKRPIQATVHWAVGLQCKLLELHQQCWCSDQDIPTTRMPAAKVDWCACFKGLEFRFHIIQSQSRFSQVRGTTGKQRRVCNSASIYLDGLDDSSPGRGFVERLPPCCHYYPQGCAQKQKLRRKNSGI